MDGLKPMEELSLEKFERYLLNFLNHLNESRLDYFRSGYYTYLTIVISSLTPPPLPPLPSLPFSLPLFSLLSLPSSFLSLFLFLSSPPYSPLPNQSTLSYYTHTDTNLYLIDIYTKTLSYFTLSFLNQIRKIDKCMHRNVIDRQASRAFISLYLSI